MENQKPSLGPAAPIPGEVVVKKLKLSDILNSQAALGQLFTQALPVKISYKLSKFIRKVDAELKEFSDFRNNLLDKYGTKDSEDKYKIEGENMKLFEAEMLELLDQELDFEAPKFTLDELSDAKLSVQDLSTLDYLIGE